MSGSGGGSSQPTTVSQTQNRDPWGPSQPYLQGIMGQASNLYGADVGYQPYPGSTISPVNEVLAPTLAVAHDIGWNERAGSTGVNAARGLAENQINNQGLVQGNRDAITGLQGVSGQYGDIYSRALGNQNPYLQQIIDTNNRRIADKINSSMAGAGRYGSGAHTDILTRALAESADPLLAQDYAQRQALQLQATQGQGATQGAINDIYSQGLNRAGQFSQMIPMLDEARFAGVQHAADYGNYLQNRAQGELNQQIQNYNLSQARPWEQLNRYSALVGGTGQMGGNTTTTVPVQQPSTMQRIFGGAAAGGGIGSMFGPWGAGIGALGGGLLGMM